HRERPAVAVDTLGVELGPQLEARERLRRERLIDLEEVDVGPRAAGTRERAVHGLDGGDREAVGVVAEPAAAGDPRERLRVDRAFGAEEDRAGAVADR